jgi:N,N-dimethylformamidase
MAEIHIHGYSDQISVKAGQRIKFMVSVEGASRYRAAIVRLINGDTNPAGPGPKEEVTAALANGEYQGRLQPIHSGSHILVDDRDRLLNVGTAITVQAFIMPTTPAKGAQGLVTRWDSERRVGWALVIDEQSRLALRIGDGQGHLV